MREKHHGEKKRLRSGFTTGTCAAGAAKAATAMLLTGQDLSMVKLQTPQGLELTLPVQDIERLQDQVSCAIQKDSGDDPDITNGILIYATVRKRKDGTIGIAGGVGIGRVTKPGLACRVGEAAINPVPRQMILSEVQKAADELNYQGGLSITIWAPEGEKLAAKTFNPRLGITGGISILGTTGVVEPMSEKAWIDTLHLEIKQQSVLGKDTLLLCPGNYGQEFIRNALGIQISRAVKCSNFVGEGLDFALEAGFGRVLLVGHAGKLVKLGAGIMNTHSRYADARMEILAVHAALWGASSQQVARIMACSTTEEAVSYLRQERLGEKVFAVLMDKIEFYVQNRVQERMKTGVILFTNEHGILGKTRWADEILEILKNEESM